MRIWDIPPRLLCRGHLLGEHRELHAIWSVITRNKKGYSRHPETLRWQGRLKALFARHTMEVAEMLRRGYRHHSPLPRHLAKGLGRQGRFVDSPRTQRELLRRKGCDCRV
ncbi:MAG: pyrimidine dimer DNA glycosylase/endonuclease V [Elusimicrobia bacterium]|nr:pyrimidine dimer DNA glycosylase/endonuclease V [Elusimicrobiota bacterium]